MNIWTAQHKPGASKLLARMHWDADAVRDTLRAHVVANRSEWVNFARPTGQPILLGFNAAAFGRAIESWSDTEIVNSAMSTLRTMYGNKIPNPTDWLITRWHSDPYAKEASSGNVLGSTPDMRTNLARNVSGRLFFAGEAT